METENRICDTDLLYRRFRPSYLTSVTVWTCLLMKINYTGHCVALSRLRPSTGAYVKLRSWEIYLGIKVFKTIIYSSRCQIIMTLTPELCWLNKKTMKPERASPGALIRAARLLTA